MKRIFNFPLEALAWSLALIALWWYTPGGEDHFTLCPLYHLGFDHCPGCGLGRSISFLFHGDLAQSFSTHPLGIFAVIVLSYRIFELTKKHFKTYGQNY
jgi:hypothetical protein